MAEKVDRKPKHPAGKASAWQYRQGCRCAGCEKAKKAENAARSQRRRGSAAKPKAGASPSASASKPAAPGNAAAIEKAIREHLDSADTAATTLSHVYGEVAIGLAHSLDAADPKDIPKIVEQLAALVKLLDPSSGTGGDGDDDPFAGFGKPS